MKKVLVILAVMATFTLVGCSKEKTVTTTEPIPESQDVNITGNYFHEYNEEIGGDIVEVKESVTLRENHSCEVTLQDTIEGEWTDTTLKMNNGNNYEYKIEGDVLYLNLDGNQIEFIKE